MRSSTERHVEGILLNVNDVPWAVLMQSGESALGEALRGRAVALEREAGVAGEGGTEQISAFNNFAT
jgi:hypothetical protein